MVKQLLIIVLGLISVNVWSQISHGGQPMLLNEPLEPISLMPTRTAMASQMQVEEQRKLPLKFAEAIYTNFTPQNSGEWEVSAAGYNVWRLAIKSDGAKSLNIIFDRFHLEYGERLFAYNPDKTHVLGAFTNENNNPSKLFAIAPVVGDEIILELQTPRSPNDRHELLVSAVNHDYLGVVDYMKRASDFDDSGECNVNAICGDLNSPEINRSVCKVIVFVDGGSVLCSGTLMNNTSQNGKPYFLTAAHCFDDLDISSGSITAQNIIFYFNFDSSNCETSVIGPVDQTISGADIKAFVKNIDLALLELNKMPPAEYTPYWAGWSRETSVADNVFSVHHPQGDVKKVSVSSGPPISTSFDFFGRFLEDKHWHIESWESGTTEGGSSGSGLFTQEQLLIGSLSGGYATCAKPVDDYYMRLNAAWEHSSEVDKQLAFWLDNSGTDEMKFDGEDFYANKELLSHYQEGDEKIMLYDQTFKGSWSGHNSMGYDGYAEYYNDISAIKIAGVYLSPAKVENNNAEQTFNIKIWDALNNTPNNVIKSIDNIPLNRMSGARQLYTFNEALEVSEPIFVGVELNYAPVPIDTLSLYQIQPLGGVPAKNTAFIRSDGAWKAYNEVHPAGDNGAYLIELLAYNDYPPTDTGDVDASKHSIKILTNPIRNRLVQFTSNVKDLSTVDVYALNGQIVKTYVIQNPAKDAFSVHGIPQGVYLLKFSSSTVVFVKKVLIVD